MSDLFHKGLEAYHNGQYNEAIELLVSASSEENESNPKILNALGVALSAKGEKDKAIHCFESALLIDPGNPTYERNLDKLRSKLNNHSYHENSYEYRNNTNIKDSNPEYCNPIIPVILSLIFPGLGYVYNGGGGLGGLARYILTLIGYICLLIPGLLLALYFMYDSYQVRSKMNGGEIPVKFGKRKDYLIFFSPYIFAIMVVILCMVAAFIFGMMGNLSNSKFVAMTAIESGENITITNYGGADVDKIEKIYVSLNGGPRIEKSIELKNIGSSVNIRRESNNDRVTITVKFKDGIETTIYDNLLTSSQKGIEETTNSLTSSESQTSENLIGYYSFNDGSASDSSIYRNDGKIVKGNIVEGISSQALNFNGISSFVELPDIFKQKPKSMTYMALVCPISLNSPQNDKYKGQIIFNGKYHSSLGIKYDGSVELGVKLKSNDPYGTWYWVDSEKINIDGTSWYHIVGVIDTENQIEKIYINGNLSNSVYLPKSSIVNLNSYPSRIGVYEGDWEGQKEFFSGAIDEVKVYNHSLTDSEIFDIYNTYNLSNSNDFSHNNERNNLSSVAINPDTDDLDQSITESSGNAIFEPWITDNFRNAKEDTTGMDNKPHEPLFHYEEIEPGHIIAVYTGESTEEAIERNSKRDAEIEKEKIQRVIDHERAVIQNCNYDHCRYWADEGLIDTFNDCMAETLDSCRRMDEAQKW